MSNMELLDIVDATDQVTGQETRQFVHDNHCIHRAAHCFVFNPQGHVFLQQRAQTKDQFPGLWGASVSGHVMSGETHDACIAREMREELGIIANNSLKRIAKLSPSAHNGFEFIALYCMQYGGAMTLCAEEIQQGRWLSPANINTQLREQSTDFAGGFAQLWQSLTTLCLQPECAAADTDDMC